METNSSAPVVTTPSTLSSDTPIGQKKNSTLIILGSIELIFFSFVSYLIAPIILSTISIQFRLGGNMIIALLEFVLLILSFIVALAQITIGLFSLDDKLGEKRKKWLIISGLVLSLLMIPLFIMLILYPLYGTLFSI